MEKIFEFVHGKSYLSDATTWMIGFIYFICVMGIIIVVMWKLAAKLEKKNHVHTFHIDDVLNREVDPKCTCGVKLSEVAPETKKYLKSTNQ